MLTCCTLIQADDETIQQAECVNVDRGSGFESLYPFNGFFGETEPGRKTTI